MFFFCSFHQTYGQYPRQFENIAPLFCSYYLYCFFYIFFAFLLFCKYYNNIYICCFCFRFYHIIILMFSSFIHIISHFHSLLPNPWCFPYCVPVCCSHTDCTVWMRLMWLFRWKIVIDIYMVIVIFNHVGYWETHCKVRKSKEYGAFVKLITFEYFLLLTWNLVSSYQQEERAINQQY